MAVDRSAWRTSRKDMDSFLDFLPPELKAGFVVYAYPPDGCDRDRVAFYGPDARERADEYAALQNEVATLRADRAAKHSTDDCLRVAVAVAGEYLDGAPGPQGEDFKAVGESLLRWLREQADRREGDDDA